MHEGLPGEHIGSEDLFNHLFAKAEEKHKKKSSNMCEEVVILGTPYKIIRGKNKNINDLRITNDIDGFCDETTKEIYITDYVDEIDKPGRKKDLIIQQMKNLRHEIIHAFLFESGLAENSDWAQNEELVDWIAIQAPKLLEAWEKAEAI